MERKLNTRLKSKNPLLISISGPLHSGKSTLSKMLSLELGHCAYLDVDIISTLISRDHPEGSTIEDLIPDTISAICYILHAYLSSGISVVMDGIFDDSERRLIIGRLGDVGHTAKWFLLRPDISKVLAQSDNRVKLRKWEIERIHVHYKGPVTQTEFATVINSTHLTAEETLDLVKERLLGLVNSNRKGEIT